MEFTQITAEQRRQFDENGYLIVPDVFSPAEVKEMLSEFERLTQIEGQLGGSVIRRLEKNGVTCRYALLCARPMNA